MAAPIREIQMRRPTKFDCLRTLISNGLDIKTVLDVGVLDDTEALRVAFPASKHYLFEPVEEFHPAIRENYKDVDFELVGAAVSDKDGAVNLATRSILPDMPISHSGIQDDNSGDTASNIRQVKSIRLDTFVRLKGISSNILLKIDVDGAEMKVLKGAEGVLDCIDVVIIEASRTYCFERFEFLNRNGFGLFDIVDVCYYAGFFHQADLVFLRRPLLEDPRFNGWLRGPFRKEQWQSLNSVLR